MRKRGNVMENQKNINENKDGTHIRNLILETFTKFGDEILSSNVIKIRNSSKYRMKRKLKGYTKLLKSGKITLPEISSICFKILIIGV